MLAFTEFFVDMDRCQELAAEGSELGAQVGDPFARDWGTTIAAWRHHQGSARRGGAAGARRV